MKYLNLCCGAVRPQSEDWTNLDLLLPVLGRWSPEWKQLQTEKNYVEHDVNSGPLPFDDDSFDGILASHCVEHWDCQEAARIMTECRRVLKTGGILLVSVPDASYFRQVHDRDTVENAVELFGEPIHLPDGETTFLGYGLFNRWHKTILTEDALWAYFVRSGFNDPQNVTVAHGEAMFFADTSTGTKFKVKAAPESPLAEMVKLLNRLPFSLVMMGVKG